MSPEILNMFVRAAVFIVILLTAFAYLTYTERRVLSWFTWRVGPNRVGPWGLFQPIADGVKTVLKQEMIPRNADVVLYMSAPVITFAAAFTIFALIPVGENVWITNVAVGVLIFLGLSSMGSYGVILAGWSSQNRFSFLGALRSCAQIISYELSLGLALLVPIMIVGSLNIDDIGRMYWSPAWNPWYMVVLIPAWLLFLISALAETARIPFDLPECESELVSGYHTEYSSMKYAMFPMGEYVAMCAMAAIAVHFFLGGYRLPFGLTNWWGLVVGKDAAAGPPAFFNMSPEYWQALSWTAAGFSTTVTFMVKMAVLIFIFMWIRATLPRLRYDQLMRLGWQVLLPIGLILVLVTAIMMVLLPVPEAGSQVLEVAQHVTK